MIYPVPKPKHKKQNKPLRNPRPTAEDICTHEGCCRNYAHNHEIFFGKNRQNSIKYKMQKRLCDEHHEGPLGPHHNKEYDIQLKKEYQAIFEAKHSHKLFMEVFGENYLDVEDGR